MDKEYKKIEKNLRTARKFMRISRTMLSDIKSKLLSDGIPCNGIDDEKLSEAIDSLDNYISDFHMEYVLRCRQLELQFG